MRKRVQHLKRQAFTLIELVMVIVILGIVSMIATDIIANMYKGYIQTKIINDLEQKTEIVIEQITKRLQYRIKPSMIARKKGTNEFLAMNSPDINTSNANMVEWIGYDNDSLLGEHNGSFSAPGWSGFIDVDSADTNNSSRLLVSPGSNLTFLERTIKALSYGKVSLGLAGKNRPAVIFKCAQKNNGLAQYGWDFDKTDIKDHNFTLRVTRYVDKIFLIDNNQQDLNRSICEQYYLAWTAYALVPEGSDDDDFNLTLKYNYQPWHGDKYSDNGTSSQLLAEHVSTFRVMQIGETLRVKICIQDGNITGTPVGFCKEKAIY